MSNLGKILSDEKNLERVLDNIPDGIIAHDFTRRIFFFNREAERITGYRREDVLGKDCHSVFGAPFCGEHCLFCDGSAPPVNQDKAEYKTHIITRNGDSREIEMTITMMKDEGGRNFGVLAFVKDVTDLIDLQMRVGRLTRFDNIIGQNSKMMDIFKQIRDVAPYDYPVHIYGETGTGKELVAAAIHNESRRSGGPFVPINCGALPEGLIESELFGHVKGAFSSAIRDKKGRFELADGGTIFLDEIAELPKAMQVKLLRFLQENKFERVGGEKTLSVNVRIISATNRDLKKEIRGGIFRDDLYYRLNVIPMNLPPLRERKTDIPLLIDHFLKQAAEANSSEPIRVSKPAIDMMMDYDWPGNIRELQNAIQFAIVRCDGRMILPQDLPLEFDAARYIPLRRGPIRKLDAESVRGAIIKAGGNKAKAARILNVGRATLYRFFRENRDVLDGLE